jgi:circadian clock protein KaiC
MRIDSAGVIMVPRLEATPRTDGSYVPTGRRATFANTELDAILGGGLPRDTATLIAGSGGIGKTLLALTFVAAGANDGERSLFYSFSEPPGNLIARARRMGLELQPYLDQGLIHIDYPPPIEADADELVQGLLDLVAKYRCTRLVVDGLLELEEAVSTPERLRPFFIALLVRLRASGVTSIFTKQISKIVGPELDFSDTTIAAIAENLIFLRNVELDGKLHRLLSVMSLRDSEFDSSFREFTITEGGFQVLRPVNSAEGLLTGRARPIGTASREGAKE